MPVTTLLRMLHIKYQQRYFCCVAIKITKFISTSKPNTGNECKDRQCPTGISSYGVTYALEMKCMKFFIYKIIILSEDGKQYVLPHKTDVCVSSIADSMISCLLLEFNKHTTAHSLLPTVCLGKGASQIINIRDR